MQRKKVICFSLLCSFLLHALILFSCSLHIEAKGTPVIYSWLSVIREGDLFFEKKDFDLPQGASFPSGHLRHDYFFQPKLTSEAYFKKKVNDSLDFPFADTLDLEIEPTLAKSTDAYFYLWEQNTGFSSQEEEIVPYNIYVSSHGKVLLVYPEKLPVNSHGNLYLQEYIREAAFFVNDRFLWTKLEAVVK